MTETRKGLRAFFLVYKCGHSGDSPAESVCNNRELPFI